MTQAIEPTDDVYARALQLARSRLGIGYCQDPGERLGVAHLVVAEALAAGLDVGDRILADRFRGRLRDRARRGRRSVDRGPLAVAIDEARRVGDAADLPADSPTPEEIVATREVLRQALVCTRRILGSGDLDGVALLARFGERRAYELLEALHDDGAGPLVAPLAGALRELAERPARTRRRWKREASLALDRALGIERSPAGAEAA